MSQIRRVTVKARSKDRMRVNLEALIVVEPGVLTRHEVDNVRTKVASRLMEFMAHEVPYLNIDLAEVKVSR